MKSLLSFLARFALLLFVLILCVFLPACSSTGGGTGLDDVTIIYTGDGIEVIGIKNSGAPGEATGAGYNNKTKQAYIVLNDGTRQNLKITGGGLSAHSLVLVLEGGTKVTINTKTGQVTTTAPSFGPPAPVTVPATLQTPAATMLFVS